jgi:hypothetical protein
MQRDEYVQVMKDLLSRDPARIRDANRRLFRQAVVDGNGTARYAPEGSNREADLVLAEVAD